MHRGGVVVVLARGALRCRVALIGHEWARVDDRAARKTNLTLGIGAAGTAGAVRGAARQLLDDTHAQAFYARHTVAEPERGAMPLILGQIAVTPLTMNSDSYDRAPAIE